MARKDTNKQYSLRKLKTGTASVAVALTVLGAGFANQTIVKADEGPKDITDSLPAPMWRDKAKAAEAKVDKLEKQLEGYKKLEEDYFNLEKRIEELGSDYGKLENKNEEYASQLGKNQEEREKLELEYLRKSDKEYKEHQQYRQEQEERQKNLEELERQNKREIDKRYQEQLQKQQQLETEKQISEASRK
ncbi:TPA: YSIRK-type signal peptide-containing protein, partial [Streptococcus pyogenes]|nr:YSIRK-type signal peptide-containing protein [Streptococcus pyogenes]HER0883732.1 YSIRK-type signal peptide-containing protein [Streptococcus pyogenes]